MDDTNGPKEIAAVALNTLSVNVFTAPGKTMVGERPKPFGEDRWIAHRSENSIENAGRVNCHV